MKKLFVLLTIAAMYLAIAGTALADTAKIVGR